MANNLSSGTSQLASVDDRLAEGGVLLRPTFPLSLAPASGLPHEGANALIESDRHQLPLELPIRQRVIDLGG